MFTFNIDEDADKERWALESLRGHLPRGLIIVPSHSARENLKLVLSSPMAELDRSSGTKEAHTVMVDNVGGAKAAVPHLTALEHQRIGVIVRSLDISTAMKRLQGHRKALERRGQK